jgi:hypothetical protein
MPVILASLLPHDRLQSARENLKKRKASATSQIQRARSVQDFLDGKSEEAQAEIEYSGEVKLLITQAIDEGKISSAESGKAISDLRKAEHDGLEELRVIKRQKKIIVDDLNEELGFAKPDLEKLSNAYDMIIGEKVKIAYQGGGTLPTKNFANTRYSRAVVQHLNALGDDGRYFCSASGWQAHRSVKAAHLVPKSLESDELAHMFGVVDMKGLRYDKRNGLVLLKTVENHMDKMELVIVPVGKAPSHPARYKFVITSEYLRTANDKWINGDIRTRDLHNRELRFNQTNNRPAARFLYWRFVQTYLLLKKRGDCPWVSEVETRGMMWATPGKYLRKSYLIQLARKVSDRYPPQVFEDQCFDDPSTAKSKQDEELGAHELAKKMTDVTFQDNEEEGGEEEEE